jgi:anaerobic selenocysteine-containing dehydrogenase
MSPLQYMRRYGAFEIAKQIGPLYEQPVPPQELADIRVDRTGRVYTRAPAPSNPNIVPTGSPAPDAEGRWPVGVRVDGETLRGFPTSSGRLEFYSSTLADWGWRESAVPTYIKSHIHRDHLAPDQMPLISTFRLPIQIHTRSANAKWLDEIAHTNPLWIHPSDAERVRVATGDLVRVETEIGHFVVKAWVTEGIRPGVVACSHHMGRWKLREAGQRQMMATVSLDRTDSRWGMRQLAGPQPYTSTDPDTLRIWWTDVGVHQNLTFSVHPDPVSGQHCWHQAVRVRRAGLNDRFGDIFVDTTVAREVYRKWLQLTRAADQYSPDRTRRPYWLMRPLRPVKDAYRLPDPREPVGSVGS